MEQNQCFEIFSAIEKWVKQRSGLDPADYGIPQAVTKEQRTEAKRAFSSDARQVAADGARARTALREARSLEPAKLDILMDSFRAFSGRLEWKQGHLSYTAGQYFPTEYRKAAASVLETYIAAWKQAYARENPQSFVYSDMSDVRAANEKIGNHWFERSTMRFFNTKICSRLIAGKRFITSERGPDQVTRYTIREAQPDGSIDTIGNFQQFSTLREAKAQVLMNKAAAA